MRHRCLSVCRRRPSLACREELAHIRKGVVNPVHRLDNHGHRYPMHSHALQLRRRCPFEEVDVKLEKAGERAGSAIIVVPALTDDAAGAFTFCTKLVRCRAQLCDCS